MTMISDNVWLAQGLFSMLLAGRESPALPTSRFPAASRAPRAGTLQPVDQAFLLSEHPLLARATASQLLAIVGAAREVPLVKGQVLFEADTAAALHLVLDGALLLQASDGTVAPVASGTTIDVAETLAGAPTRWRATVTESGSVLRLGRDELFAVLTDHVDLMQGLLSGVLYLRAASQAPQAVQQSPRPATVT